MNPFKVGYIGLFCRSLSIYIYVSFDTQAQHGSVQHTLGHRSVNPVKVGYISYLTETRQCTTHSWVSLCEPFQSRLHRSLLWVSFRYIYRFLLTHIYHTSAEHGSVQHTRGHRSVNPIKVGCISLFCGSLSIYIYIYRSLLTHIFYTSAQHGSVQHIRGHRSVNPIKVGYICLFCGSLS